MNATQLWIAPLGYPDLTDENKWNLIRAHRNVLLSQCDWTQTPDALLLPAEKALWDAYREALQDVSESDSPDDVVFPEPPEISYLPPSATLLAIRARRKAARITARNIPNWATWTQGELATYIQANLSSTEIDKVTSFAAARVMIQRQNTMLTAISQLLFALRDRVLPDLPES
jgi:hypothetical protein